MTQSRTLRVIGGAVLVALTAVSCGDGGSSPTPPVMPDPPEASTQLSQAEAQAVSRQIVGVAVTALGDGVVSGLGARASAGATIEITFGVVAMATCERGGSLELDGRITGTFDPDTEQGTIAVDATIIADACSFTHDETVFTISTVEPHLQKTGELTVAGETVTGTLTVTGTFDWSTADGRGDRCDVDLTITLREDGTRQVTGTACGQDVDYTS